MIHQVARQDQWLNSVNVHYLRKQDTSLPFGSLVQAVVRIVKSHEAPFWVVLSTYHSL